MFKLAVVVLAVLCIVCGFGCSSFWRGVSSSADETAKTTAAAADVATKAAGQATNPFDLATDAILALILTNVTSGLISLKAYARKKADEAAAMEALRTVTGKIEQQASSHEALPPQQSAQLLKQAIKRSMDGKSPQVRAALDHVLQTL